MDRTLGLPTALAVAGTASMSSTWPARGSPAASVQPAAGGSTATPAEVVLSSCHDRDGLARRMNDVVVRRIFAAGLDLQAALGLIGEQGAGSENPAAGKIWDATDQLDHAIKDLRNILFEPW